jgi:hypothetical protein
MSLDFSIEQARRSLLSLRDPAGAAQGDYGSSARLAGDAN